MLQEQRTDDDGPVQGQVSDNDSRPSFFDPGRLAGSSEPEVRSDGAQIFPGRVYRRYGDGYFVFQSRKQTPRRRYLHHGVFEYHLRLMRSRERAARAKLGRLVSDGASSMPVISR